MDTGTWFGSESEIGIYISDESQRALQAYQIKPDLVLEHGNIEQSVSQGGYGRKQLNELIQNAADALRGEGGKISVVLTADALYCANEGEAFTKDGYRTLLLSHTSHKRDDQIGRFGLGFKSVLQITDRPQIFSRSGSVGWSEEQSRALLEPIYPNLANYPLLRLAQPLDPQAESCKDEVLAQLMAWASTVIKLPLRGNVSWLQDELGKFPHHFLLFSPHIHELHLDDRISGSAVSWTSLVHDSHIELSNGTDREDWLLFEHRHKVSPAAAADAGTIFARDEVDVAWAVPLGAVNKRELGTIWNYFPTEHRLSLRGIVNAAFKMNEDRVNMLQNLYNKEILEKAVPRMVAGALSILSTENDPSAHFDILPSREKESRSWADKTLNRPVMQAVVSVPFLPDLQGNLQTIASMNIQPDLADYPDLVKVWTNAIDRGQNWVHESTFANKERASMLTRALELAQKKRSSVTEWLEAVVKNRSLSNYETALQIAAYIDKRIPDHMAEMRRSEILLMADGRVIAPLRNHAALPSDPEDSNDDLVDYEMMHYRDSLASLKSLGFEVFNGSGRLKKIARDVADDYQDPERAQSLWRLSRSFPINDAMEIFSEYLSIEKVLILRKNGEWKPFGTSWLPGKFLRAERLEDASAIIDPLFHGKDLGIFKQLGMRDTLPESQMQNGGSTFEAWKRSEADRLSEESRLSPQPVSSSSLKFTRIMLTPRLEELTTVSEQARAEITSQLLSLEPASMKVEYTAEFKSPVLIEGPDRWWIRNYGVLNTPLGLVDVKYCVGPIEGIPEGFLPTADESAARKLSLGSMASAVRWNYVLKLSEDSLSLDKVHQLYGLMAVSGIAAPQTLLVQSTPNHTTRYPANLVILSGDQETHGYLSSSSLHASLWTGHPHLDRALEESWGLERKNVTFTEAVRPDENLEDERQLSEVLFAGLSAVSGIKPVLCIPCNSIELVRSNDFDDEESSVSLNLYRDQEKGKIFYRNDLSLRSLLAEMLLAFKVRKTASDVEALRKVRLRELKQKELEKRFVTQRIRRSSWHFSWVVTPCRA